MGVLAGIWRALGFRGLTGPSAREAVEPKRRKVLVLDGHPAAGRLSSLLAAAYAEGAAAAGADVRVIALADLVFDPTLHAGYRVDQPWEESLERVWKALTWCDHFVLVTPLWWGGLPARLKGLFDRILLPGRAFRYRPGQSLPEGLLRGRRAHVIVTADTPAWALRLYFRVGLHRSVRKQMLEFCGLSPVRTTTLAPVHDATPDRIAQWQARVNRLGRALR